MKVPSSLALVDFVLRNKATLSLNHDGPLPFLYRALAVRVPSRIPDVDLSGQTVLITGANAGVGFDACKEFLRQGARVVMGVRSEEKGLAAREKLVQQFSGAQVEVWPGLEMSDFEAVKQFAEKVDRALDRLDIAILNAGIYTFEFEKGVSGYEMDLQVNVLGTALLSLLLLPVLSRTTALRNDRPARLLLVNTNAHAWASLDRATYPDFFRTETQRQELGFQHNQAYFISKVALLLFGNELVTKVDKSKVLVGQVTPGFTRSGLFADKMTGPITKSLELIWGRSTGDAARCYVHAALHTSDEEYHGGYFDTCQSYKTSAYSRSEAGHQMQKEIWTQTLSIFQDEVPGINVAEYLDRAS